MTESQTIPVPDNIKNDRLYIALELSNTKWKIAFGNGFKIRMKTIAARDIEQFKLEVQGSRKHFGMSEDVPVFCCYEAGRDGFWIHRYLCTLGIRNSVVDSSSIEVNRRYRRAKTDRIDANKLLTMLIRYMNGETKLWSVLRVPEKDDEDARRLHRETERLKKERTAHTNRIKSLLALHGVVMGMGIRKSFKKDIEKVVLWNGEHLPSRVKEEMIREYDRYQLIQQQLQALEQEKKQALKSESKSSKKVLTLQNLKGIGSVSSWVLVHEYFGWRVFKNTKEVGAASGLAPTPYDSGGSQSEQGISKSGNRRVRALMVEVGWYWLWHQPQSNLSQWFMARYGQGSKRMRRIGIVALARKLLIALWKYLEQGIMPEGATMKACFD
jgi:transposase